MGRPAPDPGQPVPGRADAAGFDLDPLVTAGGGFV